METITKIYDATDPDMPWDDWEQVRQQSSKGVFTMDPGFLHCIQHTMMDSSTLWYVLFYSHTGNPIACACLSKMRVDLALIADPGLQRTVEKLRKAVPSLLYLNIMFCGLPISLGQKSLLFTSEADTTGVLEQLDDLMVKLARQQKARFIVVKEHDKQDLRDLELLSQRGYRCAESLDMHVFTEPFEDFDHYLASLNSHYRYDIRRSLKKLTHADMKVVRWTDPETIRKLYTEELHQLYYAVVERSENKLEILPLTFFHELTRQFPQQLTLTGLVRDGQIYAFNWSLNTESGYQFMFCGMDYSVINQADLYFNLMYAELGYALQSGARDIEVGQTAAQFKIRLGCTQRPLYIFIKGVGLLTKLLLKLCFRLLFPVRQEMQSADIYNSKYKASIIGTDT